MFGKKGAKVKIDGKYISGHPMHPHEKGVHALFYEDRLVLTGINLTIPYESITNIRVQEDRHITKTRVIMTGVLVGLLWKKKYRYTVIEYNDGFMTNPIIIDFHKEAGDAQKILYECVVRAKQISGQPALTHQESSTVLYEDVVKGLPASEEEAD